MLKCSHIYPNLFLVPIPHVFSFPNLIDNVLDVMLAACEQIKEFKTAIEDDYFFEMLIDDLPLWGYIGEVRYS